MTGHDAQTHPPWLPVGLSIPSIPAHRECSPPTSDRGAGAEFPPTSTTVARSRLLGSPQLPLARLATVTVHRPAGDRHPLAPPGVSLLLEVEEPTQVARTAEGGGATRDWADLHESGLGRIASPVFSASCLTTSASDAALDLGGEDYPGMRSVAVIPNFVANKRPIPSHADVDPSSTRAFV